MALQEKAKGFELVPIDKIKIGGYYYDVYTKEDFVKIQKVWGVCNLIQKFMCFDEECPVPDMLATVVHEGLEAMKRQRALDIEHNDLVNLEDGMFQMLVDNKDFFIRALQALPDPDEEVNA